MSQDKKCEGRDWSRTKLEADWSWPQPQQLIFYCMFVGKQNKIQRETVKKKKKKRNSSFKHRMAPAGKATFILGLTYNGLSFKVTVSCFQIVFINSRVFVFYYYSNTTTVFFFYLYKKQNKRRVYVSRHRKNAKHEPSNLKNVAGSMSRQ